MKRLLFIFTIFIATCLSASAYDFKVDGIAYNMNIDGNTVTVTYTRLHSTDNYNGGSGSLVIPEKVTCEGKTYTVTAIDDHAFEGCSGFTGSLTIPNSVTSIGYYAFEGCSGFTGSLTIPNSVTSIGECAFYGCSGFTGSLIIGNSVTSIGYMAFYGCSGFNGSLTIPNSVTSIGNYAFKGCSGFTGSLTIPNSVTSIGYMAFYGCSGFTGSLTIPNSVTEIGDNAFSGCTGFTEVYSHNITPPAIGENTFLKLYDKPLHVPAQSVSAYKDANYWKKFRSISDFSNFMVDGLMYQINDDGNSVTVTYTVYRSYSNYNGGSGSLVIPEKVTYKGKTYTVTSIGNGAFYGCSGFTGSLTIPNSVTSIGEDAFYDCRGFNGSLTIPNCVTSIGKYAFLGCNSINEVNVSCKDTEDFANYIQRNDISDIFYNGGSWYTKRHNIYIGGKQIDEITIPSSVTSVGACAFCNCSGFTGSLNIPNSVTSIGIGAFKGCSGFTGSLTIGNSVTSIGNTAFCNCSGFTGSLTIGNSVTSIGNFAFDGCSGFTGSLTIPNSVTSIGECAFGGCGSINEVNVSCKDTEDFAKYIQRNDISDIFFNCPLYYSTQHNIYIGGKKIDEITIPSSVTAIGNHAFWGCHGLTGSLNIPNSVTSIGIGAFKGCSGFTGSLTIPNSVTSIGNFAFDGCWGLTGSLTIPNSVTSIGELAFNGCGSINEVNVSCKDTEDFANYIQRNDISDIFYNGGSWYTKRHNIYIGGKQIDEITIPSSVTSVGACAFCNCSGFTGSLNIPNSVTSIGERAFSLCSFSGSLSIGNSVTSIGNQAFYFCTFTEIYSLNQTPPSLGSYCFSFEDRNIPLYVPSLSIEKYKSINGWSIFKIKSLPTTSISLSPTSLSLHEGESYNIIATVLPEGADNKLTWKSSNTAVATVDANGKVTGIGPGTATITATTADGTNLSASCQVTVHMTAKSISLNKTTLTLYDGQNETLVATVTPSNTFDKSVTWKSSNTAVAIVDANGKVTGIGPGTATITATTADGTNLSASCQVTVHMTAKGVTLNKTTLTLNDGQSEVLVATVAPENATDKSVTWESSDTSVATVDENGKVTSIAPGTATITATTADGTNLSASCQVTVVMTAKGISLNKTDITLNDGQKETLVATVIPNNTYNKSVTWKSSNSAIATVDENGMVTGIAPGTATITATTADGTNLSASCQVTVRMTAKGVALNKTTLTLNDGQSETLVATIAPSNTANKSVTWKSSNTAIATVDASGKVTGVWPGNATITATTADGTNLSASCQVTVNELMTFEYKGLKYHKNDDYITAYVTYQFLDNGNNYKGLTDVTIPATVTDKYGTYTVTAIGDSAFANCSSIKSVKYASTITSIGNHAFFNSKIEGFTFDSSITSIGHYAFDNCTQLKQVIIPETVISIGDNPFARCNNLQSISVSRFNPNYDSRDYCNAIVRKADNRLISGCTYTIIPESVTTIGSYAFMGMYNLKSITIPSTVTTLDDYAFKGCSGLTTIVIPANVTRVGSRAFSECMGLTEVFCLGKVPPTTADNTYVTFAQSTYDRTPLRVRRSCIDAYKNAGSWKGFAHIEGIDGYLYAGNRKFFSGDSFTVPVELINDTEITGIQVDVKMPVGISVAMDSEDYPMVFLTDRKSRTHNIMANNVTPSTLRILSTSSNNRPFSGSEGELFNITFKTDPTLRAGMHTVQFKGIEISPCDGAKLLPADMDLAFYAYYIPGDANHDHRVSIADPVVTSSHILARNPDPFHFLSADVNEDNTVSVSDVVLIGNIILGTYTTPDIKFALPRMRGSNELSASVVESRADGTRTIAIALDNSTNYTAFQTDLQLPRGMKVTGARLTDRAGSHHSLDMNMVDDNTVRLISFAGDNSLYDGNSGDLLLIDVKGCGEINVTNALFCEPNGCEHELNEITIFTELSGINDITAGGNAPVNVYNTAGQLIRTNVNPETATQGLPAGFYLVGDKKVVVK